MKFLADVNIPQSIIIYLTKTGHDVLDIKSVNLMAKDTEIIKLAQQENRVILTLDKDFIVLTQYPRYQVACIIIRLKKQSPNKILNYLGQLLSNQKPEILEKSLTIVRDSTAESHLC